MKIKKQEYATRRHELAEHMGDNAIAILPSASTYTRNNDAEFPFRQDSDFYYLTGLNEPDAVLALIPGREHGEAVLFCRERDPTKEMWDGKILGPERACEELGVDDAFPICDIDEILPGLIEGRDKVFYALGKDPQFDAHLMEWVNTIRSKVRSGAHPPGEFVALEYPLHEQRLFKSDAEIDVMRKAGEITAAAHVKAMKASKPGLYEYSLEAEILHGFVSEGARFPAYSSIVGSGDNACILHYIDNNEPLKDGDLVLIDAGCELECYAADITRTFPVNGKFSKAQADIYQIVLDAQMAAIEQVKPNNHWNHPHEAAVEVIVDGLLKLGLLKGTREEVIENEDYKQFYMHRTGHWLGLDVHDVGEYKSGGEWRVLEPGMVMTVEPGIYIAPGTKGVAKKYQGIGIRIEDDVAVTKKGHEVLTDGVPKTIADIEALMASE